MRKRPATAATDLALDIFDDERFTSAMTAATRPAEEVATDSPQPPSAVSNPPTSPERPALEPLTEPKSTLTTELHSGKRRASEPSTLATQAAPEPNVPLKFRVPQTLRSEFHRFKAELAATLGGVALDDSNLARPLVEIFLIEQSERILEEAAAFRGHIKRPPNGDALGMAEFDHSIGEIFRRARKRRTPSVQSESAPP